MTNESTQHVLRVSRREILRRGTAVASALAWPWIVPSSVFGARAPSNRIQVACIGTGNQGTGILRRFINNDDVQILAVCDDRHTKNYKSLLQQLAQKERGITPSYRVLRQTGPDHRKSFEIAAVIGRAQYPAGSGKSKKDAEQQAARRALKALERELAGAAREGAERADGSAAND